MIFLQLKFWQHLIAVSLCIFIISPSFFYGIASLKSVKKKAPIYKVHFLKIIKHILKNIKPETIITNLNFKYILYILLKGLLLGVLGTYFLIMWFYMLLLKYSKKTIHKNYFLFPIFFIYIAYIIQYTRIYWLIYNIYPVTKANAVIFFWGVAVFHGVFEEGIYLFLSYYFINAFLYLYSNHYDKNTVLLAGFKEKFTRLARSLPFAAAILFIAAIIESMDLGACFK